MFGKLAQAVGPMFVHVIHSNDAFMEKRLDGNPGYLIDQRFYTVENTREESITDDSYFTQWEQEKPERFNID